MKAAPALETVTADSLALKEGEDMIYLHLKATNGRGEAVSEYESWLRVAS